MIEPISLEQARAHLREPPEENDPLIEGLISAARDYAERVTGLVLAQRAVRQAVPSLGRWIDLDAWPIADDAAISVSYLDGAGATQAIPTASFRAARAGRPVRLLPYRAGWGVAGALALDAVLPVTVTVEAGYEPEDVPPSIVAAMLLVIGHLFRNREAASTGPAAAAAVLPLGVETLLRPYRLRVI